MILINYPKAIKAFYMKQNDESGDTPGQTVRAMDVLFPGIGEIIGGSQREDNYEKLIDRINEVGIDPENLWWYLETRKFGSAPHSGFGLGFERLVQFVTGLGNIRDVIPFLVHLKTLNSKHVFTYPDICSHSWGKRYYQRLPRA